jgi:succinoglycan biosynthesis protein ExoM
LNDDEAARAADDQGDRAFDIALCVCTYLRPVGLQRLIGHLSALTVPSGQRVVVVIVDNDPLGSAAAVVDEAVAAFPLPIRYVVEGERGISQARNRAVQEAGAVEWIAFVDDDDWPAPDWLVRLLDTQATTEADVVVGPTMPVFEAPPDAWIVDGGFFEKDRFPTGSVVPYWLAHTGGVLIRRSALAAFGDRPFDDALGLSGGEDTTMFWYLATNGARLVWDDDAVYHELIPSTKASAKWLLIRSFRNGTSRSMQLILHEGGGLSRRVKRVGRGGIDVGRGLVALPVAKGHADRIKALQSIAFGVGLAAGVFGVRYAEYRTIHGR